MRIQYVFDSSCSADVQSKILMVENNSTGKTVAETISRVLQNLNRYGLIARDIKNDAETITFYVESSNKDMGEKSVLLG